MSLLNIIKKMISSYKNIKSKYVLKVIMQNLTLRRHLKIINYNKHIQEELNLSIKDYISYGKIEIEINIDPNLLKEEKNIFINFNEKDKNLFKFFLKENNFVEYQENYLNKNQNTSIII